MVAFVGGNLEYEIDSATIAQIADALSHLAALAACPMGPDSTPSSVEYDGETLKIGF